MFWVFVIVAAADTCPAGCGDPACWRGTVECLIDAGRAREAVDRLKAVVADGGPALNRLLARAYLADENPFWAERTLRGLLAADEDDCDSRAELAWLHVRQGDLEVAREVLDEGACPRAEAERGRWQLLRAYTFDVAGDEPARRAALAGAGEAQALFPEDLALYRQLRAKDDPGWVDPVAARFELVAGYTSNGLAGSPTDTPTGGTLPSGLGRVDASTTLVAPLAGLWRPTLELGLKAHGLSADNPKVREQSFLELSARPALLVGRSGPRVSLGYSAELLLLNHFERGRFFEAHRGEVEVEATDQLTLFAGGGRRMFREGGRSRWEVDGGLGFSAPVGTRVHLLAVTAARSYRAVDPSYNQVGGTVAGVARIRPGGETLVRTGATVGVDSYPDSGDRPENERAYGTTLTRWDLLARVFVGAWSPPLWGARAGLRYELAWRNSSADLSVGLDNYDYTEHRVVAGVRWLWGGDPFLPRAAEPSDATLDYGLASERGAEGERIRDILRQDEAARRGSSCVN